MFTAVALKQKYIDFFVKRGHEKLPNVSLIPEDVSSSALFISAGMHPLIPYLLGKNHPLGKRLVSNQRCLRTGDIEKVGDSHHLTFFEMLGNWSLGDYWKREAISWSWQFLTEVLGIPKEKISVSCFKGDKNVPRDNQSAEIWKEMGIPKKRIYFFGRKENWWGPIEEIGPCGPDSEMFIDMGGSCRLGRKNCDPSCPCGRYFEIWNDVFMEYYKTKKGNYEFLKKKNVDTGMGVERILTFLQDKRDVFEIDLFQPIIEKIESVSGKNYKAGNKKEMRIIADHVRASVFLFNDGVEPSNKGHGYILRRLLRRAALKNYLLKGGFEPKLNWEGFREIIDSVIKVYGRQYFEKDFSNRLWPKVDRELVSVSRAWSKGLKKIEKTSPSKLNTAFAFNLFQTNGLPFEITKELFQKKGKNINKKEFDKIFKNHQVLSRTAAKGFFKGGLADHSGAVIKLHTTTHLLHQALRDVLGDHIRQIGSNITPERLRFDFTHSEKLTEGQIKKVEKIINEKIEADLPVKMRIMSLAEAKKEGALALFGKKYDKKVKTYLIGRPSAKLTQVYSFEVCGGPHVGSTGEIGRVKIVKQKAIGVGRRRIYARLENP